MTAATSVMIWGAADTGKPRTRLLIDALTDAPELRVRTVTASLWSGVEDKSRAGKIALAFRFLRLVFLIYPALIARFLLAPRPDAVFVPYFGLFDVLALAPFASLKRTPIIWDAFMSLYDTVVVDRQIVKPDTLAARALRAIEGAGVRAASVILLDTAAHADYFARLHPAATGKTRSVPVGAEKAFFVRPSAKARRAGELFSVLFYGQFIPLHGAETIVDAARLLEREAIDWRIIGDGQEAAKIAAALASRPIARLHWEQWVPYETLPSRIAEADLCLGIFGTGEKPAAVIPNKIFQAAAAGKAFVTRDSAAIRELFSPDEGGVFLVEPGSARALADAVLAARAAGVDRGRRFHADFARRAGPAAVGESLLVIVRDAARGHCLTTLPLGAVESHADPS